MFSESSPIDIGDFQSVYSPYPSYLKIRQTSEQVFRLRKEERELNERREVHQRKIDRWERQGYSFQNSAAGQFEYISLSDRSDELLKEEGFLNRKRERIEEKDDKYVRGLVRRYQNLFDLFRIGHSRWQKGYTIGAPLDYSNLIRESYHNHPFESYSISEESISYKERLFKQVENRPVNENSLRMLVKVYQQHRQISLGKHNSSDFPVFVACNALRYSDAPSLRTHIDSYTMKAVVNGHSYQFSKEGLTADDVSFWYNHFFPALEDEVGLIKCLRPYPRSSLLS